MHTGKLSADLLKQIVFPYSGHKRPDVLVGPGIGLDCGIIDLEGQLAVLSSDPITTTGHNLGYLAVHIAANDVAATGAEPAGLLLTLLLPPGTALDLVQEIMQQVHDTAASLGMALLGGHTEFTAAVTQPVAVMTAIGKARRGHYVTSGGGKPGNVLILTKSAAYEGTAILAADFFAQLEPQLGSVLLERAQDFIYGISIVPEAKAAIGLATAMHDVTEGGILAATFELAHASTCGLELWSDQIPVATETAAICRQLELDPLGLIGSGSLLVATGSPDQLLATLSALAIPAAAIGRLLPPEDGKWLKRGSQRLPLVIPERDELYKAL
ncbi:MAG: AIR synthase [Firmicutes bacterium]|nr:AIR synthase [Bacillota bacterium]